MIKVKLYKKGGAKYFKSQFPKNDSNKLFWGDIEFTLTIIVKNMTGYV